jgi:hypothetical protein
MEQETIAAVQQSVEAAAVKHYRFRTAAEMPTQVEAGWGMSMDCLYGTVMDDAIMATMSTNRRISHYRMPTGGSCNVSSDMLIEISEAEYNKLQAIKAAMPKFSLTRDLYKSDLSTAHLIRINNGHSFGLHQNPTSNCQVGSISSFEAIFSVTQDAGEIIQILREASTLVGEWRKPQYIFDVRDQFAYILKKLEKHIVFQQAYISTNKHPMIMGLIKL